MLTLPDAVALSLWPKARARRLGAFLRSMQSGEEAGDHHEAGEPPPVPDPVVAALEHAGMDCADLLAADLRGQVAPTLERAQRTGIVPIPFGDDRYPPLLASIVDPPVVLWVRGQLPVLRQPAVAIVGSRAASPYGLEAATRLAAELAGAGLVIVSGLARGIDSAAHRGALQGGGVTVAVLGSGADAVYPPEHEALAVEIAETGAVVTEYVPGAPPIAFNFPMRNRIISGLALVVVVVEAAERSGSLITADCAVEQGREVLAVPGSIYSVRQAGCHALIRDGAGIASSAEDILAAARFSHLRHLVAGQPCRAASSNPVLQHLGAGEASDIDTLAARTGLGPAALLSRLLELELQGAVRRVEGSRFVRVSRTC